MSFFIDIVDSLTYAPYFYRGEGFLLVDTVEGTKELAGYKPTRNTDVVVLAQGDKAQSALLKVTEEIPKHLTIVYVCDDISSIGDALRSRADAIKSIYVKHLALEQMRPQFSDSVYHAITTYNIKHVDGLDKVNDEDFKIVLDLANTLVKGREGINIGNALKIYGVLKALSAEIDIRTFIEIVIGMLGEERIYLEMKLRMSSAFSDFERGYKTAGDRIALLETFLEYLLSYE